MKKIAFAAFFVLTLSVPFLSFADTTLTNPNAAIIPGITTANAPQLDTGTGLVPQASSQSWYLNLCDLRTLANNIIRFAVVLSVFVATLMFAYGGFLYVTASGAGEEQLKRAHTVFTDVFIGLVIVLISWLIINIFLSVLTGGNITSWTSWFGSGNQCNQITTSAFSQVQEVPAVTSVSGGQIPAAICQAENQYQGTDTSAGPGKVVNGTYKGGWLACAWSVNNVLTNAGIAKIDADSVQNMEDALRAGRGTLIDQSQAVCGDIVIQAKDGHVGLCLNAGCTSVLSNSSVQAAFVRISDTSFTQSGYHDGPGRIYRVVN